MLRTDLDTPLVTGPSTAARLSRRCLSLCFPGIVFVSCAVFGVTQCSAQDVAEAARQERAQKESKHKKSKHVYTEQDLKRAQILTPRSRFLPTLPSVTSLAISANKKSRKNSSGPRSSICRLPTRRCWPRQS